MRKLSGFWLGYLCLVLLSACVQKDEAVGPGPEAISGDVGSAQLRLPAIPPGFLAKRTAGPRDSLGPDTAFAYFILTISGPGMTPRRQSWPLDSTSSTVIVENIPVGSRLFIGELALDGDVRYADSAWAQIEKGKTAFVHLKLSAATGNAEICVEIEGLPLPASCRPPIPSVPDVSGCWYFLVSDSLFRDTLMLTIAQRDSLLEARLMKPAGNWGTSRGSVSPSGNVAIGLDSTDTFILSAQLDTTSGTMRGKFLTLISPRIYTSTLVARRFTCSIDTIPPIDTIPIPSDSSLTCWDAAQTIGGIGRFLMLDRNGNISALFRWTGYPDMPMYGHKSRLAVPPGFTGPSTVALYLYGVLPPGMARFSGRPDSVHYKGQIMTDTRPISIVNGALHGIDTTTGALGKLGEWKAYLDTCTAAERRAIRKAYQL